MIKPVPICRTCKKKLSLLYFGSKMGGKHASMYECVKCKRKVEIYDDELAPYEPEPKRIEY